MVWGDDMDSFGQLKTQTNTSLYRFIDLVVLGFTFFIILELLDIRINKDYWLILFAHVAVFSYVGESMQLYRTIRAGQFNLRIMLIVATTLLSFLILFGIVFLLKISETYSRLGIILWFLSSLTGFLSWRLIYRHFKHKRYRQGINLRKAAIIGLTESGMQLKEEILKHPEMGLKCIGFFDDRNDGRSPR